jgi:hypothetical protein
MKEPHDLATLHLDKEKQSLERHLAGTVSDEQQHQQMIALIERYDSVCHQCKKLGMNKNLCASACKLAMAIHSSSQGR